MKFEHTLPALCRHAQAMLMVSRHTQAAASVGLAGRATAEPLVGSRGLAASPRDRRQHTATASPRPEERRAPSQRSPSIARQRLRRDRAQGCAKWARTLLWPRKRSGLLKRLPASPSSVLNTSNTSGSPPKDADTSMRLRSRAADCQKPGNRFGVKAGLVHCQHPHSFLHHARALAGHAQRP